MIREHPRRFFTFVGEVHVIDAECERRAYRRRPAAKAFYRRVASTRTLYLFGIGIIGACSLEAPRFHPVPVSHAASVGLRSPSSTSEASHGGPRGSRGCSPSPVSTCSAAREDARPPREPLFH